MREITGDIWDFEKEGWIVVPIHITMGICNQPVFSAGIYSQAVSRIPHADALLYGLVMSGSCEVQLQVVSQPLRSRFGIIFFPTRDHPRQKASKKTIESGLTQLVNLPIVGDIYLPLLGCGFGMREEEQVRPLLEEYLPKDRFILVKRGEEVIARYPDSFRSTRDDHNLAGDCDLSLNRERASCGLEERICFPWAESFWD